MLTCSDCIVYSRIKVDKDKKKKCIVDRDKEKSRIVNEDSKACESFILRRFFMCANNHDQITWSICYARRMRGHCSGCINFKKVEKKSDPRKAAKQGIMVIFLESHLKNKGLFKPHMRCNHYLTWAKEIGEKNERNPPII